MLKATLTAATLTMTLTAATFAQQQQQAADYSHRQSADAWRGTKLIGAIVYGPDHKSIGDINDLLIDRDGRVTAVVVGIGGFLGVGEKNVAVPFEALHFAPKQGESSLGKITMRYTKKDLTNVPSFAHYKRGLADTMGAKASRDPAMPMALTAGTAGRGNAGRSRDR